MNTRRDFLQAAVVAGFPTIVPSRVFGAGAPSNLIQVAQIGCGRIARASEMAGILRNSAVARYVAVCDLDTVRIADARQTIESAYAAKFGSGKYAVLRTYGDYREMLADKSIDAVCISTPDHWHAQPAMEAAIAGKDIYLQKPASLTVREGRQMADCVTRTGRIFQQGSQQRSEYPFRYAVELIRNGRLGRLRDIYIGLPEDPSGDAEPEMPVPANLNYDMWLGSTPNVYYTEKRVHPQASNLPSRWTSRRLRRTATTQVRHRRAGRGASLRWSRCSRHWASSWRCRFRRTSTTMWLGSTPEVYYTEKRVHPQAANLRARYDRPGWLRCEQFGAGMITGWGAHHIDIAHWAMDLEHSGPSDVAAIAEFPREGLWDVHGKYHIRMRYANGVTIYISEKYPTGLKFVGEDGWLWVTRGNYKPGDSKVLDVSDRNMLRVGIKDNELHLHAASPNNDHHLDWLTSIKTRRPPATTAEIGHRSCSACLVAHAAMKLKRPLKWDLVKESFGKDEEANALLARKQRLAYGTDSVRLT